MSSLREPETCYYEKGTIVNCGNLLQLLYTKFPSYYRIVKLANLQAQYNTELTEFTIFVPSDLCDCLLARYTPHEICKKSTVKGKILPDALTSSCSYLLDTLSPTSVLLVESLGNDVYINGGKILYSISCKNGVVYFVDGTVLN
jgi:uncharacterized surface protein with fasciclin (FAS1) repeats